MYLIRYEATKSDETYTLHVPSSKSAANRALIIRALSGKSYDIINLSSARDTVVLKKLLSENDTVINALDAGTVIRFMTAFIALRTDKTVTLHGTERAHDRPIGILVQALRTLGGEIEYLEKLGYPPLEIKSSQLNKQSTLEIEGNVSSQFISALMMIAPYLENGLTLHLIPPVISEPYILMTVDMMQYHDIEVAYTNNTIRINAGEYSAKEFHVEADWSSAVFYYGLCLVSGKNIFIPDLVLSSNQADAEIQLIMKALGIDSLQKEHGVLLTYSDHQPERLTWDCSDCPDLVPALCYSLATKGISAKIDGIAHLRHKESDRALAIQTELSKLNVNVELEENTLFMRGKIKVTTAHLDTYRDHRMAMSAALLSPIIPELFITDPEVVEKSFPEFWEQVNNLGITLSKP